MNVRLDLAVESWDSLPQLARNFSVAINRNEVSMKAPNDISVGSIHQTKNYGSFKVIDYVNCNNVKVKFIETGYEKVTRSDKIRIGAIKDPMRKIVCGIGFTGIGDYRASENGKHSKKYICWRNMIYRCYDNSEHNKSKNPTYKGCTVCDEWHNFQNFAKWYDDNYPTDGCDYHLDKDIKINGNRVYSPHSCMFVTKAENTIKASAKSYEFISPIGDYVKIYNMRKFCLDHNLEDKNMSAVWLGKRKSCKGWRKYNG